MPNRAWPSNTFPFYTDLFTPNNCTSPGHLTTKEWFSCPNYIVIVCIVYLGYRSMFYILSVRTRYEEFRYYTTTFNIQPEWRHWLSRQNNSLYCIWTSGEIILIKPFLSFIFAGITRGSLRCSKRIDLGACFGLSCNGLGLCLQIPLTPQSRKACV